MLIRVVRMTFRKDATEDFLNIFNDSKKHIRNFPGCRHLTLMQDYQQPHIFITYSYWDGPDDLENYRKSDLFLSVWTQTKALFADKPVAFSMKTFMEVAP